MTHLYSHINEFDANGDFQLSSIGVVLSVITVLFILLGFAIDFPISFKKK